MIIVDRHHAKRYRYTKICSAMTQAMDTTLVPAAVPPITATTMGVASANRENNTVPTKADGNFKKRILSELLAKAQKSKPLVVVERLEDALKHSANLVPTSNGTYMFSSKAAASIHVFDPSAARTKALPCAQSCPKSQVSAGEIAMINRSAKASAEVQAVPKRRRAHSADVIHVEDNGHSSPKSRRYSTDVVTRGETETAEEPPKGLPKTAKQPDALQIRQSSDEIMSATISANNDSSPCTLSDEKMFDGTSSENDAEIELLLLLSPADEITATDKLLTRLDEDLLLEESAVCSSKESNSCKESSTCVESNCVTGSDVSSSPSVKPPDEPSSSVDVVCASVGLPVSPTTCASIPRAMQSDGSSNNVEQSVETRTKVEETMTRVDEKTPQFLIPNSIEYSSVREEVCETTPSSNADTGFDNVHSNDAREREKVAEPTCHLPQYEDISDEEVPCVRSDIACMPASSDHQDAERGAGTAGGVRGRRESAPELRQEHVAEQCVAGKRVARSASVPVVGSTQSSMDKLRGGGVKLKLCRGKGQKWAVVSEVDCEKSKNEHRECSDNLDVNNCERYYSGPNSVKDYISNYASKPRREAVPISRATLVSDKVTGVMIDNAENLTSEIVKQRKDAGKRRSEEDTEKMLKRTRVFSENNQLASGNAVPEDGLGRVADNDANNNVTESGAQGKMKDSADIVNRRETVEQPQCDRLSDEVFERDVGSGVLRVSRKSDNNVSEKETVKKVPANIRPSLALVRKRGRPPMSINKKPPTEKLKPKLKKNSRKSFRHDSIQTFKPTPSIATPPWRYKARPHLPTPDMNAKLKSKKTPVVSPSRDAPIDMNTEEAPSSVEATPTPCIPLATSVVEDCVVQEDKEDIALPSAAVSSSPSTEVTASEVTTRAKSVSTVGEDMSDSSAKSTESSSREVDSDDTKRKKKKEHSAVSRNLDSHSAVSQMRDKGSRRLAQELPHFNWLEEKIRNGGVGTASLPPKRKMSLAEKLPSTTCPSEEQSSPDQVLPQSTKMQLKPAGTMTSSPFLEPTVTVATAGPRSKSLGGGGIVLPVPHKNGHDTNEGGHDSTTHRGLQNLANGTGLTITLMSSTQSTVPRDSAQISQDNRLQSNSEEERTPNGVATETSLHPKGVNAGVNAGFNAGANAGVNASPATWGFSEHVATMARHTATSFDTGLSVGDPFPRPTKQVASQQALSTRQTQAPWLAQFSPRGLPTDHPNARQDSTEPAHRDLGKQVHQDGPVRPTPHYRRYGNCPPHCHEQNGQLTGQLTEHSTSTGSSSTALEKETARAESESLKSMAKAYESQCRLKVSETQKRLVEERLHEERLHQEKKLSQERVRHTNETRARYGNTTEPTSPLNQDVNLESRLHPEAQASLYLNEKQARHHFIDLQARMLEENVRQVQLQFDRLRREEVLDAERRQRRTKADDVHAAGDVAQKARIDEKHKDTQNVCARPAVPSATAAATSRVPQPEASWPSERPTAWPKENTLRNYLQGTPPHASPHVTRHQPPAVASIQPSSTNANTPYRSPHSAVPPQELPNTTVTHLQLPGGEVAQQAPPNTTLLRKSSINATIISSPGQPPSRNDVVIKGLPTSTVILQQQSSNATIVQQPSSSTTVIQQRSPVTSVIQQQSPNVATIQQLPPRAVPVQRQIPRTIMPNPVTSHQRPPPGVIISHQPVPSVMLAKPQSNALSTTSDKSHHHKPPAGYRGLPPLANQLLDQDSDARYRGDPQTRGIPPVQRQPYETLHWQNNASTSGVPTWSHSSNSHRQDLEQWPQSRPALPPRTQHPQQDTRVHHPPSQPPRLTNIHNDPFMFQQPPPPPEKDMNSPPQQWMQQYPSEYQSWERSQKQAYHLRQYKLLEQQFQPQAGGQVSNEDYRMWCAQQQHLAPRSSRQNPNEMQQQTQQQQLPQYRMEQQHVALMALQRQQHHQQQRSQLEYDRLQQQHLDNMVGPHANNITRPAETTNLSKVSRMPPLANIQHPSDEQLRLRPSEGFHEPQMLRTANQQNSVRNEVFVSQKPTEFTRRNHMDGYAPSRQELSGYIARNAELTVQPTEVRREMLGGQMAQATEQYRLSRQQQAYGVRSYMQNTGEPDRFEYSRNREETYPRVNASSREAMEPHLRNPRDNDEQNARYNAQFRETREMILLQERLQKDHVQQSELLKKVNTQIIVSPGQVEQRLTEERRGDARFVPACDVQERAHLREGNLVNITNLRNLVQTTQVASKVAPLLPVLIPAPSLTNQPQMTIINITTPETVPKIPLKPAGKSDEQRNAHTQLLTASPSKQGGLPRESVPVTSPTSVTTIVKQVKSESLVNVEKEKTSDDPDVVELAIDLSMKKQKSAENRKILAKQHCNSGNIVCQGNACQSKGSTDIASDEGRPETQTETSETKQDVVEEGRLVIDIDEDNAQADKMSNESVEADSNMLKVNDPVIELEQPTNTHLTVIQLLPTRHDQEPSQMQILAESRAAVGRPRGLPEFGNAMKNKEPVPVESVPRTRRPSGPMGKKGISQSDEKNPAPVLSVPGSETPSGRVVARDVSPLAAQSPGLNYPNYPNCPADGVGTCSNCIRDAKFLCSRCRRERYCSYECQMKHWPGHSRKCEQQRLQRLRDSESI